MRTYQIKIKQKRSELDDYELSIFTFIKDKQSVKEDLEKSKKLCIEWQVNSWQLKFAAWTNMTNKT